MFEELIALHGSASGPATLIARGIGARSGKTDNATIRMKPQPEPSTQEVLAGLVERVTYPARSAGENPIPNRLGSLGDFRGGVVVAYSFNWNGF